MIILRKICKLSPVTASQISENSDYLQNWSFHQSQEVAESEFGEGY